jgi:hypothetical protein
MEIVSAAKATVRTWLGQYWPERARARELARQYRAMFESCPDAVADLLTFGCYFDSTVGETPDATLINTGKRELALHLIAMSRITPADLRHLQERAERTDHE